MRKCKVCNIKKDEAQFARTDKGNLKTTCKQCRLNQKYDHRKRVRERVMAKAENSPLSTPTRRKDYGEHCSSCGAILSYKDVIHTFKNDSNDQRDKAKCYRCGMINYVILISSLSSA